MKIDRWESPHARRLRLAGIPPAIKLVLLEELHALTIKSPLARKALRLRRKAAKT